MSCWPSFLSVCLAEKETLCRREVTHEGRVPCFVLVSLVWPPKVVLGRQTKVGSWQASLAPEVPRFFPSFFASLIFNFSSVNSHFILDSAVKEENWKYFYMLNTRKEG